MNYFYRFGRRIPLPSTLQIKHELRVFSIGENARKTAGAGKDTVTTNSNASLVAMDRKQRLEAQAVAGILRPPAVDASPWRYAATAFVGVATSLAAATNCVLSSLRLFI
jgi:hypothetical protein